MTFGQSESPQGFGGEGGYPGLAPAPSVIWISTGACHADDGLLIRWHIYTRQSAHEAATASRHPGRLYIMELGDMGG